MTRNKSAYAHYEHNFHRPNTKIHDLQLVELIESAGTESTIINYHALSLNVFLAVKYSVLLESKSPAHYAHLMTEK